MMRGLQRLGNDFLSSRASYSLSTKFNISYVDRSCVVQRAHESKPLAVDVGTAADPYKHALLLGSFGLLIP